MEKRSDIDQYINYILENKPHLRVCFTNANEFMSEMVVSIQGNKIAEFRRKYTELVDVLIIDDVHELKDKARTQSEFFFIFNDLFTVLLEKM